MKKIYKIAYLLLFQITAIVAQTSIPINQGLTGTWYNPETTGQGILLDINDNNKLLFGAWFTYEKADSTRNIGAQEHRWYTIQGTVTDSNETLIFPIFNSSGGIFDQGDEVTTNQVGTAIFHFSSCQSGHLDYQFDSSEGGVSGGFDIQRITPDSFCQQIVDNLPVNKVKITLMGNEGVFIEDDHDGLFIDAVGARATGFLLVPSSVQNAINTIETPYDKTRAVLVTHIHGDHFGSNAIIDFINLLPQVRVFVTSQMQSLFTSISGQLENITISRFNSVTQVLGNIKITTINTRHFNNPFNGQDFSSLENYAYVIEIGGKKILHTGDIDYSNDNFQAINDAINGGFDVIILPTFSSVLITQEHADLVRQFFPNTQIIAAHLQSGNPDNDLITTIYPDAIIFNQPLEFIEL